jgi:hypothetical protein
MSLRRRTNRALLRSLRKKGVLKKGVLKKNQKLSDLQNQIPKSPDEKAELLLNQQKKAQPKPKKTQSIVKGTSGKAELQICYR